MLWSIDFLVIYFLCIVAVYSEVDTGDFMKREYSLIKPYQDGHWDFVGSTMVTNNYVRLTPEAQSKRGHIWNTMPNTLPAWELHIHLKVHGSGTDLFGDGMAIWYAKHRMEMGPVFGSKDLFHGLAIFMDTYSNHNGPHNHGHPYISAMVNNGTLSYDHDRDGTHTELAGCEAQFRNAAQDTFVAIRYADNKLTVSTDIDGQNEWKQCFTVSGVRLPTGYYFGASATTGELADNHDIISMKLYDVNSAIQADIDYSKITPQADFFAPPRAHVDDPSAGFLSRNLTGWKLLVIIFLGVIGVGVCAMVGFIVFSKQQESQRKRFY